MAGDMYEHLDSDLQAYRNKREKNKRQIEKPEHEASMGYNLDYVQTRDNANIPMDTRGKEVGDIAASSQSGESFKLAETPESFYAAGVKITPGEDMLRSMNFDDFSYSKPESIKDVYNIAASESMQSRLGEISEDVIKDERIGILEPTENLVNTQKATTYGDIASGVSAGVKSAPEFANKALASEVSAVDTKALGTLGKSAIGTVGTGALIGDFLTGGKVSESLVSGISGVYNDNADAIGAGISNADNALGVSRTANTVNEAFDFVPEPAKEAMHNFDQSVAKPIVDNTIGAISSVADVAFNQFPNALFGENRDSLGYYNPYVDNNSITNNNQ